MRANLVQGPGGVFVDSSGSSRGISNELDRDRLLALRELCDVVVTDGETARREQYKIPASADLAVITRIGYSPPTSSSTRKYLELRYDPTEAIQKLFSLGYQRILLEVGPGVLKQLIERGFVDELCLTNTGSSKSDLSALGIVTAKLMFQESFTDTTFSIWREILA